MKSAIDFAKYFISQNRTSYIDSFDGNMKLQKMLFFANIISYANYNKPLFNDTIYAFSEGCVVNSVRTLYKNQYERMMADSINFNPDFSEEEKDIVDLTISIFGGLPARELSSLNHEFSSWLKNYREHEMFSEVPKKDMIEDTESLKQIIKAILQTRDSGYKTEVINEVKFFVDPSLNINDELINYLYNVSLNADETSYTVYKEGESLVVY